MVFLSIKIASKVCEVDYLRKLYNVYINEHTVLIIVLWQYKYFLSSTIGSQITGEERWVQCFRYA